MSGITSDVATSTMLGYVREQWNAASFSLPWPTAATPSTARPPLMLETDKYEPPKDGDVLVRALVRHGESKQRTIAPPGSQKWETQAALEVQVWAPPGDGTDSVMATLLAKLRSLFEGKQVAAGFRSLRGMRPRFDAINGQVAFKVVDFPFSYIERK